MSSLFGTKSAPAPAPLPAGPDSAAQEAARLAAERDAAISASNGRRSQIVAGMTLQDESVLGAAPAARRRTAGRELVG